jgi:hypothetical protein
LPALQVDGLNPLAWCCLCEPSSCSCFHIREMNCVAPPPPQKKKKKKKKGGGKKPHKQTTNRGGGLGPVSELFQTVSGFSFFLEYSFGTMYWLYKNVKFLVVFIASMDSSHRPFSFIRQVGPKVRFGKGAMSCLKFLLIHVVGVSWSAASCDGNLSVCSPCDRNLL